MCRYLLVFFSTFPLFCDWCSVSRADLIVVPNSASASEGNSNSVVPFNTGARTNQYQMTNAALGMLPTGAIISAVQFRMDGGGGASPASSISWSDYEITFAKASNSIASMSSILANNMTNPIKVKDGAFTLASSSLPGTGTPRNFGGTIVLDIPYTYTGGDLVMHLTHTNSLSGTTLTLDAIQTDANGTNGIRAISTPVGFQIANADNMAFRIPVMRFVYTVPEPSSIVMCIIASFVSSFRRRRII